jgi:hypothetical protein
MINSRSIQGQSQINHSSVNIVSEIDPRLSKFSSYGQKAIAEAKKNGTLIEFARNFPSPKERKNLLADKINAKNSDIWIKYVFREAYGITSRDLGPEFTNFLEQVKGNIITEAVVPNKQSQILYYKELLNSRPLDDKKIIEGCNILLWLFSNGYIDRKVFLVGVREIAH